MNRFLSVCLCLLILPLTAFAQSSSPLIPNPPALAAKAWVLLDWQSRQLLVQKEADRRIEPASLTKLMTAYLVFDALKQKRIAIDQIARVSERGYRAEGSRMFLDPRIPVTVEDLLKGMVVQSGNDATITLAETVGGSEDAFADLMNKQAERMGLKNTHYVNSTGLPDPQHYTTARDLATLAANLIRDFPEYLPLYSTKEFRYNNITQYNRNRLLTLDPTVDGLKTGFTETAGYCLIATAKRAPRRLISVVLGTASDTARATESQKLLNYGFQFYDTVRLYEKGQAVSVLPVFKGSSSELKAGFTDDFHLSIPQGMASRLKASLESMQPLIAPVAAGDRVGTLKVTLDGKPVGDYAVVALESIGVANIFGRAWDSLRLMLK
ncbi:MAG: D-alanyl-D-alanine carboxypeptidase [Betaproteobacteria bacterium]|nr:D-alanyl-D-alanine carboxypeptidase [Betaproteobacteria bacterium]